MSNKNINITSKNIAGKCDLKCSYNFKYSESNSTAKNTGVSIQLTYDSSNIPPVIYNEQKYVVDNIVIISPSIHVFNGDKMPAEIIISHSPVKGGNALNVSIPCTSSSESSTASQIITEIIQKVSTNAPSQGESTNLNMQTFNLEDIIPKKPFFAYSEGTTDWIIFGNLDSIPLSSGTVSTLQKIIKPFPIQTPGKELFYNSKGPISGVPIGSGIYISCNPTSSSDEVVPVEYDKSSSSTTIDFSNTFQNPVFLMIVTILIGCLLFIIIFYGLSLFYNYISSDSLRLPTIPKLT